MPKPAKHKRKGPKSTRAGCLLCKPHKHQGLNGSEESQLMQVRRQREAAKQQMDEVG